MRQSVVTDVGHLISAITDVTDRTGMHRRASKLACHSSLLHIVQHDSSGNEAGTAKHYGRTHLGLGLLSVLRVSVDSSHELTGASAGSTGSAGLTVPNFSARFLFLSSSCATFSACSL